MNDVQDKIFTQVICVYRGNGGLPLNEQQIETYVDFFSRMPGLNYNLTEEERSDLIKDINNKVRIIRYSR